MRQQILIGRQDIADFPELGLEKIEVKVDTGAYTSSFHCHTIEVISNDGRERLHCFFLDPEHERYDNKEVVFDDFSRKRVRSSNGLMEERFSVKTSIRLFEQIIPLELTLTERASMRFPVLLGRKFLSGRFVVDSGRKNLSYRRIVKVFEWRYKGRRMPGRKQ
ncbi:MAG: RimK/LysX family protein [Prolixibacteraceae bacterium]